MQTGPKMGLVSGLLGRRKAYAGLSTLQFISLSCLLMFHALLKKMTREHIHSQGTEGWGEGWVERQ